MISRLSSLHRDWRLAGCAATVISLLLLASAGSAKAATKIGESGPPSACSNNEAHVQDTGLIDSIPFDGVITSYTAATNAGGETKLLILTRVSGTTYNVAEKSSAGVFTVPANTVQTFPTRLTVRAGQLIGNYGVSCELPSGFNYRYFQGPPEPATGANQDFNGLGEAARNNLSATLELDADRDGFGDETQDQCPTNAATQGPCPQAAAPTTARAEDRKCDHLRKKLKRQKAKLEKADTAEKRSVIEANIEDTRKRLEKLGCK